MAKKVHVFLWEQSAPETHHWDFTPRRAEVVASVWVAAHILGHPPMENPALINDKWVPHLETLWLPNGKPIGRDMHWFTSLCWSFAYILGAWPSAQWLNVKKLFFSLRPKLCQDSKLFFWQMKPLFLQLNRMFVGAGLTCVLVKWKLSSWNLSPRLDWQLHTFGLTTFYFLP